MKRFAALSGLSCVALFASRSHLAAAQNCYTAEPIPSIDGTTWSSPMSINDLGEVTGWISGNFLPGAFLYRQGQLTALEIPGYAAAFGQGINDSSHIAIGGISSSQVYRAFLLDELGYHDIGNLGGGQSYPFAINGADQIVGYSYLLSQTYHAFLWDPVLGMKDLGVLPLEGDTLVSYAQAINDSGQVIGSSGPQFGFYHGFVWTEEDGIRDLGTLGGPYSWAIGTNCLGQIVGASAYEDQIRHAVLWMNGQLIDLGTVTPAHRATAVSINQRGQIVGWAYPEDFELAKYIAFLYDIESATMNDLNDLVVDLDPDIRLTGANGINDAGQITASAYVISRRELKGFVLNPCQ